MRYARIEENAMDSPKFIAINAAAWRLWCEGSTYCQKHLTDGFIPSSALRGFRYFSQGALKQLCEALAPGKGPLWHKVEGGIQVHDYLDWNDPRDKVLKARKDAKDRLDRWKAEQAAKRNGGRGVTPPPETRSETLRDVPPKQNGTEQNNPPERAPEDTRRASRGLTAGVMAGSLPRDHIRHAWCSERICVPDFIHARLQRQRGGDAADADTWLRGWYVQVVARWDGKAIGEPPEKFWPREFAAQFPAPSIPKAGEKATGAAYKPYTPLRERVEADR